MNALVNLNSHTFISNLTAVILVLQKFVLPAWLRKTTGDVRISGPSWYLEQDNSSLRSVRFSHALTQALEHYVVMPFPVNEANKSTVPWLETIPYLQTDPAQGTSGHCHQWRVAVRSSTPQRHFKSRGKTATTWPSVANRAKF